MLFADGSGMIMGMEAASFWGLVLSGALVLILVLMTLSGFRRGFIKSIKGAITSILAIVLAVVLASPLGSVMVDYTSWGVDVSASISESIADSVPNAYVIVRYSDDDGDTATDPVLMFETDTGLKYFSEIFSGSVYSYINVASMVEGSIAASLTDDDGVIDVDAEVIFVDALSDSLTDILFMVIGFVVALILVKIILSMLFYFVKRAVQSLHLVYFIDKMLGALIGAVVGVLVLLLLTALLELLSGFSALANFNAISETSTVYQLIKDSNFIYSYLSSLISK
ncbi:MAG: CvpA family protein [Bacillota bacterium]